MTRFAPRVHDPYHPPRLAVFAAGGICGTFRLANARYVPGVLAVDDSRRSRRH